MKRENNKKVSIIIASCDAYKDIVDQYLCFLQLNWPDCRYDIFVAFESLSFSKDNVEAIACGAGTTWTQRVISLVRRCNSDLILLSVDDLFISEKVDQKCIDNVVDFIINNKIRYYRIPVFKVKNKTRQFFDKDHNVEKIPSNERYNVSIGTAIWNREELLTVLGDGHMSAWDLENYFLNQAESSSPGFLDGYVSDTRFLLHSVHMIKSGKWIPKSVKIMNKLGYQIDTKNRGFIGLVDRIKLNSFYSWCSRKFPTRLRRAIKKVFSFFGFKFASK